MHVLDPGTGPEAQMGPIWAVWARGKGYCRTGSYGVHMEPTWPLPNGDKGQGLG